MAAYVDEYDSLDFSLNKTDLDSGIEEFVGGETGFHVNDTGIREVGGNATTIPMIHHSNPYLLRWVTEVCINFPLATLGIAANIIAFIVLCRYASKLSTTILLQALAVSDTLVLLFSILLRSLPNLKLSAVDTRSEGFMIVYRWAYPTVYFFRLVNMWLVVLLTVDHFIAVCRPASSLRLYNRRRTLLQVAAMCMCAFLFSLPRYFEFDIAEHRGRVVYVVTALVRNTVYSITYRIILFSLFMYIIPVTVMVILNVQILRAFRRSYSMMNGTSSLVAKNNDQSDESEAGVLMRSESRSVIQGNSESQRSVTSIVITIVTLCLICNLSALVSHMIWSLQMSHAFVHVDAVRRYLAIISNIMITLNSASNFVVYCVCSRKFRGVFVTTFCPAAFRRRKGSTRKSSTTNTHEMILMKSIA